MRVEPLARSLKVSKGSFYWHFEDRAALLEALLVAWEQASTLSVIEEVEASGDSGSDRLLALMYETFRTPIEDDKVEAAIRAWASREIKARNVVRRVDRRRLRYVEGLLVAVGLDVGTAKLRAHILYRTLIGESIARGMGARASGDEFIEVLHGLLVSRDS